MLSRMLGMRFIVLYLLEREIIGFLGNIDTAEGRLREVILCYITFRVCLILSFTYELSMRGDGLGSLSYLSLSICH